MYGTTALGVGLLFDASDWRYWVLPVCSMSLGNVLSLIHIWDALLGALVGLARSTVNEPKTEDTDRILAAGLLHEPGQRGILRHVAAPLNGGREQQGLRPAGAGQGREREQHRPAPHLPPVSYTHLDVYKRQGKSSCPIL